jgi:hypothetical protein
MGLRQRNGQHQQQAKQEASVCGHVHGGPFRSTFIVVQFVGQAKQASMAKANCAKRASCPPTQDTIKPTGNSPAA